MKFSFFSFSCGFTLRRNSSREALWPGNAGSYISPEIPSFQPRESGKGDACSRGQGIHIFPIPAFPWRDSARGSMPWLVNIDPANSPWTGFACDPQLQGLPAGPPSIGARVHLEALPHAVPGLGLRCQGRGPREGLVLVSARGHLCLDTHSSRQSRPRVPTWRWAPACAPPALLSLCLSVLALCPPFLSSSG